ncbi:hypothetical protein PPTG_08699 [Phytophthora nicotianae INRA-310]|uniref:Uncharacterized protein n=1 Tax=Phytophthora nicotianae (strain INRA-310) TaxID=761204 RepID=W2QNG5_PHYN3|nr:hypothetical protein PPTG_08699 [Phytophthora nicotianae INRA-310]ETN14044.1 hypothetical protein PPTG_08699 [Phytophthora nicotianae INRA-310]
MSPMGNGSDADAATEAVPASPIAHERGEELEEEKVTLDPGALAALINKLTAKVESLERSLETHQQQAAVTPPGTGAVFGQSVYRQALQHGGSLGMQRMQMHELGASNFAARRHAIPGSRSSAAAATVSAATTTSCAVSSASAAAAAHQREGAAGQGRQDLHAQLRRL